MSFNAIREAKILAKISGFTVTNYINIKNEHDLELPESLITDLHTKADQEGGGGGGSWPRLENH